MSTRAYGREGEAEGPQDLARKGKSRYKDMALSLQDSTSLGKSFRSGKAMKTPEGMTDSKSQAEVEPGEVRD